MHLTVYWKFKLLDTLVVLQIDKYFDDCFNYLQSVVASNLKLRFEVCGPHLFQKVHSIWKTVWIEEGKWYVLETFSYIV